METSFSSTGPVSHPDAPQESDHSALPQSADTQLYPAVKTSESIFTPHGTEQGSRKSPHDENQLDEKRTINGLPSESHITANGSCHKSNDKQSPTSASHSESTVTVSGSSNSDEPKNIPNGSYPKVNGATDGSNISPTGESKVTPNGCAVIPNGIRSSIKLDSAPLIATNGTSILSNSSDISSRQSGCDNAKTASSNPTPARKSSLTLSLARRGSGFTNPMGRFFYKLFFRIILQGADTMNSVESWPVNRYFHNVYPRLALHAWRPVFVRCWHKKSFSLEYKL